MTELDQKLEQIIHDVMNQKIVSTIQTIANIHQVYKDGGYKKVKK